MTDITLDAGDGTYILVDGRVLKATASDFILDSPTRHRADKPGFRRALVHDQADGLTINFNRDYPGGVTINDVVALNNRFHGISLSDVVQIEGFNVARAGSADAGDAAVKANEADGRTLLLRGQIMFELIQPKTSADGGASKASATETRQNETKVINLQQTLVGLQDHVQQLTRRVAELEKNAKR